MSIKLVVFSATELLNHFFERSQKCSEFEKSEDARQQTESVLVASVVKLQASHCLVVFEAGGTTWRDRVYPISGKWRCSGLRHPTLALLKPALASQGWAVAEHDGYSSADTVASAVSSALDCYADVTVMTGDARFEEWVRLGAKAYDYIQKAWMNPQVPVQGVGLLPRQMMDAWALRPYHSSTVNLLQQYSDLDGVFSFLRQQPKSVWEGAFRKLTEIRELRKSFVLHDYLFSSGVIWSQWRQPLVPGRGSALRQP